MADIILDNIKITVDSNETEYNEVCNHLYEYNVRATNGLLKSQARILIYILKMNLAKSWAACFVKLGLTVCILMSFG